MGDWPKRLGRLGFVAKGLLYAIVALIAIELARGERRKAQSEEGAIEELAHQPFGEVLLWLLAVGLAGYALFRLRIAVLGPPGESGVHAAGERIGSMVLMVVYAGLCVYTVRFLTHSSGGGGTHPDELTRNLLDESYGVAAVIAIGVVMVGVACYEAWKGLSREFLDDLEVGRMSSSEKNMSRLLGTIGYCALAVTSAIVGYFLIKAAVEHEAKEAVGLDGALQELVDQRFGPLLLGAVAAGLLAYAAYAVLVEARYRRM